MSVSQSSINKFLPRAYLNHLEQWAKQGGAPILLSGWRQVGKSTSVAHFGECHFDDTYHLNFLMDPELKRCFDDPNPKLVIAKLESRRSLKIIPGKTLLILDEVQSCPQAIEILGHFRDAFPKLHVLACGTFVDFAKESFEFSVPVGRVTYLSLNPLSFKEFLVAIDEVELSQKLDNTSWETSISGEQHQKLLDLMNEYMMVGGMPAVVSAYVHSNRCMATVREEQRQLWRSVRDAFSNMTQDIVGENSEQVLLKMLHAIIHEVKDLSQLSTHLDTKSMSTVVNRVFQSGLFSQINAISSEQDSVFLPINEENIFRTAFIDVGLLHYALTADNNQTLTNPLQQYGGMVARQFIAQHLLIGSKGTTSLKYPRSLQQGLSTYEFSHGEYAISMGENPHSLFNNDLSSSIKSIRMGVSPLAIRNNQLVCPLYLIESSSSLAASAQENSVNEFANHATGFSVA